MHNEHSTYMAFLGVKVDNFTLKEAQQKVDHFLLGEHGMKIFTPNPEMVVKAQYDYLFREVLNSGDLNLCDGAGLSWLGKFNRITGVDFMMDICSRAEVLRKKVYLLGSGNEAVVKEAVLNLRENFPTLEVVGTNVGPSIRESSFNNKDYTKFYNLFIETKENEKILEEIKLTCPDVLFVAFGMGKQEMWIKEFLPQLPSIKIAMGVGGAFDYIAKKVSRAPCFMRKIGLEWLYRVFREPKRIKRIMNATLVFFFYYLRSFFKNS